MNEDRRGDDPAQPRTDETASSATDESAPPANDESDPSPNDETTPPVTDGPEGEVAGDDAGVRPGARDVVVPLELYKIVTVFSTLIAVVLVVGGFLVLDAATRRATLPPAEIDPVLTVLGLLGIAGGGVVYAFASRFRAPGMGTSKNDDDQGADNG